MKRSHKLFVVAVLSMSLAGLGGCATTAGVAQDAKSAAGATVTAVQSNKAGVTGAVIGGVVVNAAGCGFSWPWCAVRTAAGVVVGWFGGKYIAGEK